MFRDVRVGQIRPNPGSEDAFVVPVGVRDVAPLMGVWALPRAVVGREHQRLDVHRVEFAPFLQWRWGMTSGNDGADHVGEVLQKPAQDELQALLKDGKEELLAREGPSPPWLTALLTKKKINIIRREYIQ
jgi:hypothetical protein